MLVLRGILTPAEYSVCKDKEGLLSVKENRNSLVESGVEDLKEIILTITGHEVVSFHTDLSTRLENESWSFKLSGDCQNNLNKKAVQTEYSFRRSLKKYTSKDSRGRFYVFS